jgi:pimeloyl-ACP methyl ester carboxylesterase
VTPGVIERAYRFRKNHGAAWPLWSSLKHVSLWESRWAPRLGSLPGPALIIWGQHDRFLPLSAGEDLHRAIPNSRLIVIPDTGHLPMWERPDEVNRLITEFLIAS